MQLSINTIKNSGKELEIILEEKTKVLHKSCFFSEHKQSEMLLPAIASILKKENIKIQDIDSIKVYNAGGTFTSLRIGVLTANSLAYAMGIDVIAENSTDQVNLGDDISLVNPVYDKEPNISL